MQELFTLDNAISFLSLTLMEIVLGIDNIIFISILCGRLPQDQQGKARSIGIILALVVRIMLLFAISWLAGLQSDVFSLFGIGFSARDMILMAGGLFLIYKSTSEIHHKLEGMDEDEKSGKGMLTFQYAIVQIILLDVVFSFDSILTAIGLVDNVLIMVAAVLISMVIMLFAAKSISDFIHKHPTLKMLALSFLLMIGMLLMVEGFDVHVPKGYVYFAIFFSLLVEVLNMRMRKNSKKPVELKKMLKE